MNRALFFLIFSSITLSTIGQKVPFHSAYSFGSGIGFDDMVIDAHYQGKYIYTIGFFSGSVDFDPSQDFSLLATGSEKEEIYFAKYDTLDNLIWIKHLESETNDEGLGITADEDGNVLICGLFKSQLDLDPSAQTFLVDSRKKGTDGFVAKYDSLGNFKWGFSIGGYRADAVVDVKTDKSNNCIITGYFCDTIDIDPGSGQTFIETSARKDIFLIKYDENGKLIWANSFGNDDLDDEGKLLHIDKSEQIYLSGTFHKTVDFDPSSSSNNIKSAGDKDVFMAKYTNSGNHIWAMHIAGRDDENISGMAINDDKIWVCGDFGSMCDFDPSSNTHYPSLRGYTDVFLSCYDTSGSFNWVHSFGANSAYNYSNGVAADPSGNVYLACFSDVYVDWDPSKKKYSLRGPSDIILASYNNSGNFRWAHKLGGAKIDMASTVIYTGSSIGCYGYFDTKARFNPSGNTPDLVSTGNLISAEGQSAFHARYAKNGVYLNAFSNTDDLGSTDLIYSVANDKLGNVYVGGHISGIVDVDQNDSSFNYLYGRGIGKILLAKYDSNMVLDYAINFASTGHAQIRDIVVDDSLNLYFTGIFEDTLFLSSKYKGKRIISDGLNDAIFGKINSKGELVWIKRIGGISRVYGHSIDLDSKGNIIISGGFVNKVDFDPSFTNVFKTSLGNYDAFLAKYTNSGQFEWVVNFGNSDYVFCLDSKVDGRDNIYVTGSFRNSCNFNPKGSSIKRTAKGEEDLFVCKYNSDGEAQWVHNYGSTQSDFAFGLEVDENENVYCTGGFSGQLDFDYSGNTHNLSSLGDNDVFLLSLDSLGNYRWSHKYGSASTSSGENGRAIEYNNGRIYLAGTFNDTADFDPSSKTYYLYQPNVFLAVMDTLGNFEEAHSYGNQPQPEEIFDISFSKNGLYLCGAYRYDTDFDPSNTSEFTLLNKRSTDGYLLRLNVPVSCRHSFSTLNVSQCGAYTLPSGKETAYESGTYYDVVRNSEGCDSIITIIYERWDNLISNNVATCGPYQSPAGHTYTQSGTYYDTLSNQFSCDSVIITHLQINSTFESTQAVNCDSYYLEGNQQWVTQSGIYVDSFKNHLGCDSLIEVQVTINHAFYNETSASACGQFTIPSSQLVVQQSGIYRDSFQTTNGCDSVQAWNVTINAPSHDTISQAACDQFYLEGRQQNVQQSGLYNDTLTSTNSCDSIITWDLDFHYSKHDTLQKDFCDSFYLKGSNLWVNQSGIYQDSFESVYGCDSTVSWNIEKTELFAQFQIFGDSMVADSGGYENYQWFSCDNDTTLIQGANSYYYISSHSGKYALAVTDGECFEFSTCKQVIIVSGFKNSQQRIKLFPNPTTGILQIQILNSQTILNGSLYAINGKKLLDIGSLINGVNHIDMSALAIGSYILTVEGEDGYAHRELIMKK